MAVDVINLAREAKLIRSGLPLQELARRAQLVEQLERQLGQVKTDAFNAGNAAKTANTEAKNATKQANTLRGQIERDVRRLGNDINKATKPLQDAYKKVDDGVRRLTKGLDKFANAAGIGFGIAGVAIGFMALWASEANQAAFDRQIDRFQIDMASQGGFNLRIQNRVKKLREEFDQFKKVTNRELDLQSQALKVARQIADRAAKLANDGLYEARTRLQRLNDGLYIAKTQAARADAATKQISVKLQQVQASVTKAASDAQQARVGVRLVDTKATNAASDAQQARVGVRLVDTKASTALTTAQQLPAKIPAIVQSQIQPAIAPIKATNAAQDTEIATLKNRVTAIQYGPRPNTGTSTGTGTNAPTINQAQVNQAITNAGVFLRINAAQSTADAALARSTAALNKPELEPIGRNALGLGANNAAAIDRLNQDIQQLKAPNILEPRLRTVETKVREQEKVNQEANQKLDFQLGKLEQLIMVTGGLTLMAPRIIDTLGPKIDNLPGTTAAAVAAAPCNGRGCGGRTAQRVDDLAGELGSLRNQVNGLPNTIANGVNAAANVAQIPLLNTINSKLGAPVPGGIGGLLNKFSESFERFAKWSQMDRALNLLSTIATLHNAYMLSNALSQTLFSMLSNSLAVFGIKDYSQDKDGQPFDVGKIFNDFINNVAKATLGAETVDGIKTEWKKYNRIYQAASNILWSIQSIGYSILGAMEILGNWVATIGNALRRFGVVAERAYKIMNPEVNFQNRFFTAIDKAENFASNVDQIAQEVLSAQDSFKNLGTQKKELDDAVGATGIIQTAETASKTASASPAIAIADQIKPES